MSQHGEEAYARGEGAILVLPDEPLSTPAARPTQRDAARRRRTRMKLVVAIVRPEKLPAVLEALFRAEVRGLTLSACRGTAARRSRSRPIAAPP